MKTRTHMRVQSPFADIIYLLRPAAHFIDGFRVFAHTDRRSKAYIPTSVPTYIHTCIYTYLHTYLPAPTHTPPPCMCACVGARVYVCMCEFHISCGSLDLCCGVALLQVLLRGKERFQEALTNDLIESGNVDISVRGVPAGCRC
eukprot:GHVU01228284.1.p2 GENE.GHVU01228284.1~~GHVU01228284.1.p2  ORF type:complete len:144 (-),score=2.21 GHVU01228284.1:397-828(-)